LAILDFIFRALEFYCRLKIFVRGKGLLTSGLVSTKTEGRRCMR
jgi:hypothetical protein